MGAPGGQTPPSLCGGEGPGPSAARRRSEAASGAGRGGGAAAADLEALRALAPPRAGARGLALVGSRLRGLLARGGCAAPARPRGVVGARGRAERSGAERLAACLPRRLAGTAAASSPQRRCLGPARATAFSPPRPSPLPGLRDVHFKDSVKMKRNILWFYGV